MFRLFGIGNGGNEQGASNSQTTTAEQGESPDFRDFVCPITQEIMQHPVIASDGNSYEREAIERWFTRCQEQRGGRLTSPLTNVVLRSNALIPNLTLLRVINDWRDNHSVQQRQAAETTRILEARITELEEQLESRSIQEVEAEQPVSQAVIEGSQIMEACASGDLSRLQALAQQNPNVVLQRNDLNQTVLYVVCEKGHDELLSYLFQETRALQDINTQMIGGYYPMHVACINNHTNIVRILAEYDNTQIEKTDDSDDRTPLYFACRYGQTQVVEFLLSREANLRHQDIKGHTPFFVACREGHLQLARHLLVRDPGLIDIAAHDRETPLEAARANQKDEIVRHLESLAQVSPTSQESEANSPHSSISP